MFIEYTVEPSLNARICHKLFGKSIKGENGKGVLVDAPIYKVNRYASLMKAKDEPNWMKAVTGWLETRKRKKEIRKLRAAQSRAYCGHIPVKRNRYNPATGVKE